MSSNGFSHAHFNESDDFNEFDDFPTEKWQNKMDNLPKKVKCRNSDKRSTRLFMGQTTTYP